MTTPIKIKTALWWCAYATAAIVPTAALFIAAAYAPNIWIFLATAFAGGTWYIVPLLIMLRFWPHYDWVSDWLSKQDAKRKARHERAAARYADAGFTPAQADILLEIKRGNRAASSAP